MIYRILYFAFFVTSFSFIIFSCKKEKNCPSADFTVTNSNCEAPCEVSFKDVTPGGSLSQRWEFGDGNSENQESAPKHKYLGPGKYTVKLTSIPPGKCEESIKETVVTIRSKVRPIADFSIENGGCIAPCTINFKSNSTPNTATHEWVFGDGSTSNQKDPSNRYTKAGTYNVTLVITSRDDKSDPVTKSVVVAPPNQAPPIADFSFSNDNCTAPCTVTFSNLSSNATDYSWNFGDNSVPSTLPNPTHRYEKSGVYTVSLVAKNSTNPPSVPSTKKVTIKGTSIEPPVVYLKQVTLNQIGSHSCFLNGNPDVTYVLMKEKGSFDEEVFRGALKTNAVLPAIWLCDNCPLERTADYYFDFFKNDDNHVCLIGQSAVLKMSLYDKNFRIIDLSNSSTIIHHKLVIELTWK